MRLVILVRINQAYSRDSCIEKYQIEVTGFGTVNFDI